MNVAVDQGESQSLTTDDAAARIEAQLFGKPKQEEREEEPEAEEPEESEIEEPEIEESEESEIEEPEEEESESVEGEEPESEITTLEELAKALEKSPEDLLQSLKATVKINGKVEQVTLAELQAGYQKDAAFRQNTQQFAQERKTWETVQTQAQQVLQAQLAQAAQIVQAAEQFVIKPLDEREMAELRVKNPAEWSARIQEHQAQNAYLQQLKTSATQMLVQQQQAAVQEALQQRQAILAREREQLAKIPGWGSELKSSLDTYLTESYGFSNEDLQSVADHRIVDIVRKAHLFDKMQSSAAAARKKVAQAPQMVKTGKPALGKNAISRQAIEQAKARLKKTGSRHDAAKLIELRLR